MIAAWASSMSSGGTHIPFSQIQMWLKHEKLDPSTFYILNDLRFPRTMMCLFVGASLGLSGLLLQTQLKNPLSEPYTLGLSGGASLGAMTALVLAKEPLWLTIPLGAVFGCFLSTGALFFILYLANSWTQKSLILVGVMLSLFFGSVVVFLVSLLEPTKLQAAVFWMMGQVGTQRDAWWPVLAILFSLVLFISLYHHHYLDRLLLGEETALSLGTPIKSLRNTIIIAVALLTAASVSMVGIIGFVGLLSPHLAASFIGTVRHKLLILMSSIVGASILVLADILGRSINRGQEIPAGSIVALIGAPLFIFLLIRNARHAYRE